MALDSNSVLKAIELIADSKVSALRLDKTITAQIVEPVNLDRGEYKVKYQGNTFSVFSNDLNVTYKTNDTVYVKVPENDFSNKKFIEGQVKGNKTLTQIAAEQNLLREVGCAWSNYYNFTNEVGITAGKPNDNAYIFSGGAQKDDILSYAKDYHLIKISADFLTSFLNTPDEGNYGVIVKFMFKNMGTGKIEYVSYRLDFNNFVGTPYNYTTWAPQSLIIDTQGYQVCGIEEVMLFQEGFATNTYDRDDIFCRNFDVQFVETIDLTKVPYYLDIMTPKGNHVRDNWPVELVGDLLHNGESIMKESNCSCYWYVRDMNIVPGDNGYDKLAGPGWKSLDSSDEVSFNKVKVTRHRFAQATYKLVTVYGTNTLSREITLYGSSSLDASLRQNNDLLFLDYKMPTDESVVVKWFKLTNDGYYSSVQHNENVGGEAISLNDKNYKAITYFCQLEDSTTHEPLLILSFDWRQPDVAENLIVSFEGDEIYQYDANGDIAYESSTLDRYIKPILSWKPGYGGNYTLSWRFNGVDTSKTLTYTNTMIKEDSIWVDTNKILHYNIESHYYQNKASNNLFSLVVTMANGEEYVYDRNLLFLKDGDQGTNGGSFAVAIVPTSYQVNDNLAKLSYLTYNNNNDTWGAPIELECKVYYHGNQLQTPTITWQHSDKVTLSSTNTLKTTVNGDGNLDAINGNYYVTAIASYGGERVSVQYPIDVLVGASFLPTQGHTYAVQWPQTIQYNSMGAYPQYVNREVYFKDNDVEKTISQPSGALSILKNKTISPPSQFDFSSNHITCLTAELDDGAYYLHPVMMYLNTYGNEAINGWDGTSIETENGHILAPMIGAGEKTNNGFSGVLMGKVKIGDNTKIGLFGYSKGKSSFGFNEDGTAYIGPTGKRLEIDTRRNVTLSGDEMTIDLSNGTISGKKVTIDAADKGLYLNSNTGTFNFKLTSTGAFNIKDSSNNDVFYASNNQYILKGGNNEINLGSGKIDLFGTINAQKFYIKSTSSDNSIGYLGQVSGKIKPTDSETTINIGITATGTNGIKLKAGGGISIDSAGTGDSNAIYLNNNLVVQKSLASFGGTLTVNNLNVVGDVTGVYASFAE